MTNNHSFLRQEETGQTASILEHRSILEGVVHLVFGGETNLVPKLKDYLRDLYLVDDCSDEEGRMNRNIDLCRTQGYRFASDSLFNRRFFYICTLCRLCDTCCEDCDKEDRHFWNHPGHRASFFFCAACFEIKKKKYIKK